MVVPSVQNMEIELDNGCYRKTMAPHFQYSQRKPQVYGIFWIHHSYIGQPGVSLQGLPLSSTEAHLVANPVHFRDFMQPEDPNGREVH